MNLNVGNIIKIILKTMFPRAMWNMLRTIKSNINYAKEKIVVTIICLLVKRILQNRGFAKLFKTFEKNGFHILPADYYSPIPNTHELLQNKQLWFREANLNNINFNKQEQLRLNGCFSEFQKEFELLPSFSDLMLQGYGSGYGEIEALILHCFIRYSKPRVVIEVGAGVSTFFSSTALSMNRKDGISSVHVCIEPDPYQKLRSIPFVHSIVEKKVQEVDIKFFQQLNENDILFIDSSHTVKIGSDVNYLILEILPALKKGVIIHFHDIPFPYTFPYPDFWIFERLMFWQEPVLLKAFLTNNNVFEIIYCSSYLHFKNPGLLKSTFPKYDNIKHFPSSIWIRKIL